MRKKFKRISCLLLVVLCMASFSITAFAAETDSTESTEAAELEIEYSYVVDEDGSIIITVGGATTEETVSIGTVVTNGGRLNLRTGAGMSYEIIDQLRNGETENVYFLNLVDESDLLALIEGEDGTATHTCSCTDKCAIGSINTNCEICRSNMSECTGKEAVVEPEPTEPVTEAPDDNKSSTNFLPIIVLILAGGVGGAVYWFKFRKPKNKTSGSSDLDDYDFGEDDEDYEEETEYDDADLMAESEDNS